MTKNNNYEPENDNDIDNEIISKMNKFLDSSMEKNNDNINDIT